MFLYKLLHINCRTSISTGGITTWDTKVEINNISNCDVDGTKNDGSFRMKSRNIPFVIQESYC